MLKIKKLFVFWILLFILSPIIVILVGDFIYSLISCTSCGTFSNYCCREKVNNIFSNFIFVILIMNILFHLFIFIKNIVRHFNPIISGLDLLFSVIFSVYMYIIVNISVLIF